MRIGARGCAAAVVAIGLLAGVAARSLRGSWRIVAGSDHLIASSQPQAVVDAVYDVTRR